MPDTTTGDVVLDIKIGQRAEQLFAEKQKHVYVETDKLMSALMIVQWFVDVIISLLVSPIAWPQSSHDQLMMAIFLGGFITAAPVLLALKRPGETLTRHVIAISQMVYSSLLIHLTGGRVEAHFHVFGSLAVLSL